MYTKCRVTKPMAKITGRRVQLSLPRRWIADIMHLSRGMPCFVVERRLNFAEVVAARTTMPNPPSWPAIFVKAYALVALRRPELRRSYQTFPWAHFYEADISVASVAVNREYEGEPAVFFGPLHAPDRQSLAQLTGHLHDYKTKPVEEIRAFARLIKYTRYPKLIRRFLWWVGMNLTGKHRAKSIGTFGLSTLSSRRTGLLHVPSPCATTLTYGPVTADGTAEVRLSADHRVLDGLSAALALEELERVLGGEILRELQNGPALPD